MRGNWKWMLAMAILIAGLVFRDQILDGLDRLRGSTRPPAQADFTPSPTPDVYPKGRADEAAAASKMSRDAAVPSAPVTAIRQIDRADRILAPAREKQPEF
jgi:hypothetical protein